MTNYRHRLALTAEQATPGQSLERALTSDTGMEAYQFINGSGTMMLVAPELNFFAVVRQSLSNGRREIYSNIRRAEFGSDFFDPPADAVVKQLTASRGIVKHK